MKTFSIFPYILLLSSACVAGTVEVFPVNSRADGTEITSTVFYQISYDGQASEIQESRIFPLLWEPGKELCVYAIADSVRSAPHCITLFSRPVAPSIKLLMYMEEADNEIPAPSRQF